MARQDTKAPAIVWFRDDLRLADQPALANAVATGKPLICVYVLDDESEGVRPIGAASRWWLHYSLAQLGAALAAIGGRLDVARGPAEDIIAALVEASGADTLVWTRRYGRAEHEIDARIKAAMSAKGLAVHSFNGQLLNEPWAITPAAGGYFRVFTPYWRAACAQPQPPEPLPAPVRITAAPVSVCAALVGLDALDLLPRHPDWAGGLRATWTPGEAGAHARLDTLAGRGLSNYGEDRNRPDVEATSRLSPHLRFGEVSARQVWHFARHLAERGGAREDDVAKFLSELGWREFSYALLFHFPDLATKAFQGRFDTYPVRAVPDLEKVEAWRRGRTGYPIVDAGMRELWKTGYMHNRVRMIAASFLIKDLLADWRIGEAWFWDTLCDADPANNPASWQWVAGSGADASPFYRVFNPMLQGGKFDPSGTYVMKFVPELKDLDKRFIHAPWTAPGEVIRSAGVALGVDYPAPIVDHAQARQAALAAFSAMRA